MSKDTRINVRLGEELEARFQKACCRTGFDEPSAVRACLLAFCEAAETHGEITMPFALIPKRQKIYRVDPWSIEIPEKLKDWDEGSEEYKTCEKIMIANGFPTVDVIDISALPEEARPDQQIYRVVNGAKVVAIATGLFRDDIPVRIIGEVSDTELKYEEKRAGEKRRKYLEDEF